MNYEAANLGKHDPEYGGILTDVSKLSVGTSFYVCNGGWYGKIVMKDGVKQIRIDKGRRGVATMPFHENPNDNILAISEVKHGGE